MVSEKEDFSLRQTQVQTSVSFASFMAAAVFFFIGLLLTQFKSFDIAIKMPVAFLIVSMFGFLYAALIFENAAGEISRKNVEKFRKHILTGDILSEYLGVYMIVLSIPLVMNVITSDIFLRVVTLLSSLAGLVIYQFSHFSIMERHFEKKHHLATFALILFEATLFFTQLYNIYFVEFSTLFIVFILAITYHSLTKKE